MEENRQSGKVVIGIDVRRVIYEAIERGVNYGYRRAYKHTDTPDEDNIKSEILKGIELELDEMVVW